ncbi:hypothetical protein JTE90_016768 [Oedothorax gibbosus]|uniref:Uncharacterized protein n=1 Tax=Oedothorax gibbosus TaxID=931172 RepID=A0AAV6VXA5_9ARAC|nr:hypothetical protein JTE90_016768 [Oedothorax gibbosus]
MHQLQQLHTFGIRMPTHKDEHTHDDEIHDVHGTSNQSCIPLLRSLSGAQPSSTAGDGIESIPSPRSSLQDGPAAAPRGPPPPTAVRRQAVFIITFKPLNGEKIPYAFPHLSESKSVDPFLTCSLQASRRRFSLCRARAAVGPSVRPPAATRLDPPRTGGGIRLAWAKRLSHVCLESPAVEIL